MRARYQQAEDLVEKIWRREPVRWTLVVSALCALSAGAGMALGTAGLGWAAIGGALAGFVGYRFAR